MNDTCIVCGGKCTVPGFLVCSVCDKNHPLFPTNSEDLQCSAMSLPTYSPIREVKDNDN